MHAAHHLHKAGVSFAVLEAPVRANRVLDLTEQEGLQAAYIPGACDGTVSNDFMICAKMARMVIQLANCVKRGTTC